jgi:hypothetical protein
MGKNVALIWLRKLRLHVTYILSFGGGENPAFPPPLFITALVQFTVYVFIAVYCTLVQSFAYHLYRYHKSFFVLKLLNQDGLLLHGAINIVDLCFV